MVKLSICVAALISAVVVMISQPVVLVGKIEHTCSPIEPAIWR